MHTVTFFFTSFIICNFVIGYTIIESDFGYNDISDFENNSLVGNVGSTINDNILVSTYAMQKVGKSHRFFYTNGERKPNDVHLDRVFKQTGWKTKTDAHANLTYPNGRTIKSLTFVMLTVYQESDENRINIIDGGIDKSNIVIGIQANKTRYLSYSADFYGFE